MVNKKNSVLKLMRIINIVLILMGGVVIYYCQKETQCVLAVRIMDLLIFAMWVVFNFCEANLEEKSTARVQRYINIVIVCVLVIGSLWYYYQKEVKDAFITIMCVMILVGIWNSFGHKYFNPHVAIFTIVIGMVGLIGIGCLEDLVTLKKSNEEKVYEFSSEAEYKKFKELYQKDRYQTYIITDFTEDTLVTRNLIDDGIDVFSFASSTEYEQFVENNTMGKGVYVPILGDKCKFADKTITVVYKSVTSKQEVFEVQKEQHKIFVMIWYVWINLCIISGALYGRRKNDVKKA